MMGTYSTRTKQDPKRVMSLPLIKLQISWKSTKQILVAMSWNHGVILTIYVVASECTWLRAVVKHSQSTCGLSFIVDIPTIFEDNYTCFSSLIHNDTRLRKDTSKETIPSTLRQNFASHPQAVSLISSPSHCQNSIFRSLSEDWNV